MSSHDRHHSLYSAHAQALLLNTPLAVLAPVLLGIPLAASLFMRESLIYLQGVPAHDASWIAQILMGLGIGVVMVVGWLLHRQTVLQLVRAVFISKWLSGWRHPLRAKAAEQGAVNAGSAGVEQASGVVAALQNVTRRFGSNVALDNVNLVLRQGELLALLGPNGAGKSSAISLWLGLTTADSGQVTLLGGSPLEIDRRRGMGVMMQDVALTHGMKVRELITQAASYYPNPLQVQEALAITGTTALADRVYDKLSGGQKRQVQFALAICGRPRVLFLDEPTVGLDIAAREHLWSAIRNLRAAGVSILLTTHYLEEAEALADRVVVLAKGQIVASGTVDEVRGIVSRRHIRCSSTLSPELLSAWPGVVSVSRLDAQRLAILTTDAEAVLRRLLATDQGVRNLEVQQAGLAEAFVELTKEAA